MSIVPLICAPKPALHIQGETSSHEIIEVPGRVYCWAGTKVHEDGIVTEASLLQPAKAARAMEVTDAGIVTAASELQPLKAALPMSVTEDGMITVANLEQPLNADATMLLPDTIVTCVRLKQLK